MALRILCHYGARRSYRRSFGFQTSGAPLSSRRRRRRPNGNRGKSDKKSEVNTPDDREKKKSSGSRKKTVAKQMDLPGCFLYSATLACIMYGFSSITSSLAAKILLPLGILLLICFLRRETRTEDPLIRLDMFRKNIVFSFSNIAALLNYGASYAVSYLLSIYLQTVMGFDSQIAGLILITSPVFQTILSPVAGRLSDRYSPFLLSSVGMESLRREFSPLSLSEKFSVTLFSPRWWLRYRLRSLFLAEYNAIMAV